MAASSSSQRREPPEYVLRGLRMSLGVCITMVIAFCIICPRLKEGGEQSNHYVKLVKSSGRAAGVTCVVVAAPYIGKVAQVAQDRTIGTILGGLCGWLAFCLAHKVTNAGWVETYALVSALAFGAAWASVVIGYRIARLEVTPRLFTLTFLLVAYDGETVKGDLEVMVTRVAGILAGVAISLTIAMTVYPQSATQEVLERLKSALNMLAKLNHAAVDQASHVVGYALHERDEREQRLHDEQAGWEARQQARQDKRQDQQRQQWQQEETAEEKWDPGLGQPLLNAQNKDKDKGGGNEDGPGGAHTRASEVALVQVLDSLNHAKEMLPLTEHEAYIGTIFGRMFFLPAMHFLRMRHLDRRKAEAVMREVRGTAWLLWRIHLAFRQMASRQGMGAYLALILIQKLPQDIMKQLVAAAQAAFDQTAEAFPDVAPICDGIQQFRRQVDLLLNFSERQHKKILAHLRKERWHRAAARHEPVGPPTQAESSLASVVNWEEEHQSTFVHLPGHDIEEGVAQNGNGSSNTGGEAEVFEEHLWEAAAAEVGMGIPRSSREVDKLAESTAADVVGTLSAASPEDQAVFSADSVEGKVAEVRWYSFLVLMEELADELGELHARLRDLAASLPNTRAAVRCGPRRSLDRDLF